MSAYRQDGTESVNANLSFEDALAQLDETVEALESGKLLLSEATALYEKGMELARMCNEMLAAAELKISQIQTAYDEEIAISSGKFKGMEGEN